MKEYLFYESIKARSEPTGADLLHKFSASESKLASVNVHYGLKRLPFGDVT